MKMKCAIEYESECNTKRYQTLRNDFACDVIGEFRNIGGNENNQASFWSERSILGFVSFYGKHYAGMYEGSMVGKGAIAFALMGYVIANMRVSWIGKGR